MRELVQLKLYISVSALSLATEEGCNVVRNIPLENLMVESNAPMVNTIGKHVYVQKRMVFPVKEMCEYNPSDPSH